METVHGRRTCDVQVDQALLDATNLPLVAAPGSLGLAIVEPRSGLAHSEARDDRAWPPRVGACNRGSAPHFCHSAQQLHAALRFLKPSDCQPSPAAPPRRAKVTRGHPAPEASGRMKPSRSSIRSTAVQISQEKKRGVLRPSHLPPDQACKAMQRVRPDMHQSINQSRSGAMHL